MRIGVHLSISGGMHHALEKAHALRLGAVQIFLKNSNRWEFRAYTAEEINRFKEAQRAYPDIVPFAHAGYLINLAGTGEVHKKSIAALTDELIRAEQLGIKYVVIHPGSHGGRGLEDGIRLVADSLDRVFRHKCKTKILLETTAGQGSSIGHRFEHLRAIIENTSFPGRLGVCLDTCHIFAAGYDISSKLHYSTVISDFEKIVGLKKLKLIHINDSKKECGSNVDRHEHIGKGRIGNSGFRLLLHDARLKDIPMILETPKFNDDEWDRMNLTKIRNLLK
jgi:deoxyribonuclease IV